MFKTLKAAKAASFRPARADEYGGEQITIKGHTLVRNPQRARSRSEWWREGYRVKEGERPHGRKYSDKSRRHYDVYREDQVEPKRKVTKRPPKLVPILAAVWTINRRAKRCRDLAARHYRLRTHQFAGASSREKRKLYDLKSQALHYLLTAGRLTVAGYHRFPDGNWAEVLTGEGYTFHRPCPAQDGVEATQINEIEAKPRGSEEPKIKDALFTVEQFLADKPRVNTFQWTRKEKARATRPQWRTDSEREDNEREEEFGADGPQEEGQEFGWDV